MGWADLFKTKNGYLYLGSYGPAVYGRALKAMGIDSAKYPHQLAGASKEAIESELGRELAATIEQWMLSRTSEEGMAELRKNKVPCGIPRNAADLAASEHYEKRGNWVEYEDQTLGKKVKAFGFTPKLSVTKPQVWRGAPRLGQDTEAVLKTIVGYNQVQIESLKGKGVID